MKITNNRWNFVIFVSFVVLVAERRPPAVAGELHGS